MNQKQKKAVVIGVIALFAVMAVATLSHQGVIDIPGVDDGGPRPIIFCLVHEEERDDEMSKENLALFTSEKLKRVLEEVCMKDPESGAPMMAFLDNDTDAADNTKFWRNFVKSSDFAKATDDNVPYLFISDGKRDGPGGKIDPNYDVDAMIALVRKESRTHADDN